eukprot:COSAG01_NODE_2607_length_7390_cov_77.965574_10_plen_173_part_00
MNDSRENPSWRACAAEVSGGQHCPSHPQPPPATTTHESAVPVTCSRSANWMDSSCSPDLHTRGARNQAALSPMPCRGIKVMPAPPDGRCHPSEPTAGRCYTDAGGDNGIAKCRIVGKSQSVLIMINPIISTRTRIARYHPARDSRHSARSDRTSCGGGALRRRKARRRRPCG